MVLDLVSRAFVSAEGRYTTSPDLTKEIKRLRESNEILKAATVFFAGELDPRNR